VQPREIAMHINENVNKRFNTFYCNQATFGCTWNENE